MVQVDLITGFLGSGKTTFIKKYLKYWSGQGKKIKVIENEFGSVSVDKKLLEGEECTIDDLSGCCMCCTGKDKFMNMLGSASDQGFDRVLVEPSGIYDVDEFFSVMSSDYVSRRCETGSILTVVDTEFDDGLSEESRYLMFAQLLAAGTVLFSKVQCYDSGELEKTKRKIAALVASFGIEDLPELNFCEKNWEDLTDEDFRGFAESGYSRYVHDRHVMNHSDIYMSYMTADYCEDLQDLEERIEKLFTDPSFGEVLRIKGFIRDLDRQCYEINCTRQDRHIHPSTVKRGVCVIIGQKLKENVLKERAFIPRRSVVVE